MRFRYFSLVLITCLLACNAPRDVSTRNLASMYHSGDDVFHVDLNVFLENDTLARVFVRCRPEEFLFIHQQDDQFRAFARITLELISGYESGAILDTVSAPFTFEFAEKGKLKTFSVMFPLKHKGEYLLHSVLRDQNRNLEQDFYTPFDNSNPQSREHFLVTTRDGIPLFRNYVTEKDTVFIRTSDTTRHSFLIFRSLLRHILMMFTRNLIITPTASGLLIMRTAMEFH